MDETKLYSNLNDFIDDENHIDNLNINSKEVENDKTIIKQKKKKRRRVNKSKKNNIKAKKKTKFKLSKILLAVFIFSISIFIVLTCIFAFDKFIHSKTVSKDTILSKGTYIEGINVSRKTSSEALDIILKKYPLDLNLVLNDDTGLIKNNKYSLNDFIKNELNLLIQKAINNGKGDYKLDLDSIGQDVDTQIDDINTFFNSDSQNAGINKFNPGDNSFSYDDGINGINIDDEQLKTDLKDVLEEKSFSKNINIKYAVKEPLIKTKEEVETLYKTIGSFTTSTTDDVNRNSNIQLALNAINGYIILPGKEFSFNEVTGSRNEQSGYKNAGIYSKGIEVQAMGEGVDQVSSTLYNAIIYAGLSVSERHYAKYEPAYVTPGQEAIVDDTNDMKFINTTKAALGIRATLTDNKITISLFGIPVLNDGEKVYLSSEKTATLPLLPPEVEIDNSLAVGEEKIVSNDIKGSEYTTTLMIKKGNEVVSKQEISKSIYNGKAATIKKNEATELTTNNSEVNNNDISNKIHSNNDKTTNNIDKEKRVEKKENKRENNKGKTQVDVKKETIKKEKTQEKHKEEKNLEEITPINVKPSDMINTDNNQSNNNGPVANIQSNQSGHGSNNAPINVGPVGNNGPNNNTDYNLTGPGNTNN